MSILEELERLSDEDLEKISKDEQLKKQLRSKSELNQEEIADYIGNQNEFRQKYLDEIFSNNLSSVNDLVKNEDKIVKALINEVKKKSLDEDEIREFFIKVSGYEHHRKVKSFKEIFLAIEQIDEEQKKRIPHIIITSEEIDLAYIPIEILYRVYKLFVSSHHIDKVFYEKYLYRFLMALNENKSKIFNKTLNETLRESSYRLLLKIKEDDKYHYEKRGFKRFEKYYQDLYQKYENRKNPIYIKEKDRIQKLIKSFKSKIFTSYEYKEKLKDISNHSMYILHNELFDLVLYIKQSLQEEVRILENDAKYSFKFFLKNDKNSSMDVMLNELFPLSGFSFGKIKDSHLLSFDELSQATYISDKQKQTSLLNAFKNHENVLYLCYAFSYNPSIDESFARAILKCVNQLDYLFPFSEDVSTTIFEIERNLEQKFPDLEIENEQVKSLKKHQPFPSIHSIQGFELINIEHASTKVMNARYSSLNLYMNELESFLTIIVESIDSALMVNESSEVMKRYFNNYLIYLYELMKQDRDLKYYEKFYLPIILHRLKVSDFVERNDYAITLFMKFINLKVLLLKIILKSYQKENGVQMNKYKQTVRDIFSFFESKLGYDFYWDFKHKLLIYKEGFELDEVFEQLRETPFKESMDTRSLGTHNEGETSKYMRLKELVNYGR